MSSEIIALQCPSCGSSDTVDPRVAHFGYEFTCRHCRTTSVLVINSKLHIRTPGEHVCSACGRVASAAARYCQCGASLVVKCRNLRCEKEFPVDHSLCDFCGWPILTDPESPDGCTLRWKMAIRNVSSHDHSVVFEALRDIQLIPNPTATLTDAKAIAIFLEKGKFSRASLSFGTYDPQLCREAMYCLTRMGPHGLGVLVEISRTELSEDVVGALAMYGEAAASALLDALTRISRNGWKWTDGRYVEHVFRYYGCCGPNAIPILIEGLKSSPNNTDISDGLIRIGRPAIPALKQLTGFFADSQLKNRAHDIINKIK